MNKEAAEGNPQGQTISQDCDVQSDTCRAGCTLNLPHNHSSLFALSLFIVQPLDRATSRLESWRDIFICFHTFSVLFLVCGGKNEALTDRVRIGFPLGPVMLNIHAGVVFQGTLDALQSFHQMVKSCTTVIKDFCLHASKS